MNTREEIIKKAQELLACGALSKEACDAIKNDFPELTESEDEKKVSPFENALRNIFDEAHDKKVGSIEYPTWDFITKHVDKLLNIAREGYVPREEKWKEVETTARNEFLRGYEEGKKEYDTLQHALRLCGIDKEIEL